jgi:nucleoid-associated protein YgaU
MNNQGELVDLPAALLQLTTLAFLGVAAWAALVALLASWRPTKHIAMALTPRLIRAAVFTTVSGTLVISPARADSDLDGLPFPDRGVTSSPATPTAFTGDHVVRAGESLWSIAAGTLTPQATAAQVASASAAWYEANRAEIGPNPDLIHPGEQLTAPDAEASR